MAPGARPLQACVLMLTVPGDQVQTHWPVTGWKEHAVLCTPSCCPWQVPPAWTPEVQKEMSLGKRSCALLQRRSGHTHGEVWGPRSPVSGQACPALTPRNTVQAGEGRGVWSDLEVSELS